MTVALNAFLEMPLDAPWDGWLHPLLPLLQSMVKTPPTEENPAQESKQALQAEERALAREVSRRPESFQVLYDRYYERILNFFYRRVRERAIAEDLTSQTFLSALEHLARAEREIHFRPWIYRVATNAWLSHERRRTRWGERFLGELGRYFLSKPVPTPGHALSTAERMELLRKALMGLPPRYREPLLLRYDEELSDSEIAQTLEMPPGTVRSLISRGLAILRHRAKSLLGEPI
jgi:RNA polymerase sigma-70 factor (ECF subfamily)